ncbi:helix-turn-helix transcriptional regulator [Nocardioides panacis]|nr:WYL domain-containing protein [Nocardioides panacis]
MNLLITLLVSRTYVTKDRLREAVEPYREAGDEAFEKMFERDKEELRSLGIPIEVGFVDRAFEDEPGYRIERSAFELPEIDLAPEEAAVIGLAARVWQHAGLAAATSDALVKLKAAGVTVDRAALDVVQPTLSAEEPAFEPLWNATRTRTPVRFGYRTSSAPKPATRHLQPWGVVSYRGRWYVTGQDTDRGGPRVFRLSRVQGEVTPDGAAGSFEVPPGTDLRAMTRSLAPQPEDRTARLLLRRGTGHGLRRHARVLLPDDPDGIDGTGHGDVPEGWERLEATYGATEAFEDEVLGYGADVVVEAPQDVRESVVRRLREAAGEVAS